MVPAGSAAAIDDRKKSSPTGATVWKQRLVVISRRTSISGVDTGTDSMNECENSYEDPHECGVMSRVLTMQAGDRLGGVWSGVC